MIGKLIAMRPLPSVIQQYAKTIIFTIIQNLTIILPVPNFASEINSNAIMNKLLTILSLVLMALVAMPADAATRTKRTITLKKVPKQPKDDYKDHYKIPAVPYICYVDKDSGMQPLDTSEIESYEVWDCTDSTPIAVYENETDFVDYILNDDAQGIIKLFTPDYIYVGELNGI